ncbi:MAG TPA: HpsJ family protein [Xenococcaceae cyanobacterium]
MSNINISQFTSLSLKTVGVVLVVSSLLDYITLAIPFDILESQWQINFTSQIVDRGIVPMVGIGFLLVGYWIDTNLNSTNQKGFDLKLPTFILCLVLGFMFLLLVPIHLNNLRLVSSDALSQLEERASEAETRINDQYQQLEAISQDPQRLQILNARIQEIDTALSSGQFQGQSLNAEQLQRLQETKQQLENFRELAQNPEALEARLSELQTQLRTQKLEREGRARTETLKQGVRTGFSSLILAIGYLIIGWFGFKMPKK